MSYNIICDFHSNGLKLEIKGTHISMVVMYAYIYVCMCMIKGSSRFYCLQLLENIDLKFDSFIRIGFKSLFQKYFEKRLRDYSIIGYLRHQS